MKYTLYIFFALTFFACKKDESVIISGNVAPPDYTIEQVIIDNYINKLYISVLGREPLKDEFDNAISLLGANVSKESRIQLVENVQANDEYFDNLFNIFRQDYLNGIDTTIIRDDYINVFQNLIENSQNPLQTEQYEYILEQLILLYQSADDMKNGSADPIEIHRRCVNNQLYDDINMGTENYVVSMYQNFLQRYPSEYELELATIMVDGEQSVCFGENGDSKNDFNSIFFQHDGYFEGQVVNLYNRILYRSPNSYEATSLSQNYKQSRDYKNLQKELLITDEFLGIQ